MTLLTINRENLLIRQFPIPARPGVRAGAGGSL